MPWKLGWVILEDCPWVVECQLASSDSRSVRIGSNGWYGSGSGRVKHYLSYANIGLNHSRLGFNSSKLGRTNITEKRLLWIGKKIYVQRTESDEQYKSIVEKTIKITFLKLL